MADEQLLDKIHSLSDLELAALLCLIAREHCLISTEPDSVDELAEELRLVASKTFNLNSAVISCHAHTTLDEFATGLLVQPARAPPSPANTRSVSPYRPRHEPRHEQRHEQLQLSTGGPASLSGSYFPMSPSLRIGGPISPVSSSLGGSQILQPRIANVILAKDLDRASRAVQIQALELLRTRRIFTRTNVQTAPKQFLFIALVGASSGGQARVTPHLNDFFYLGHWHDPDEDGFPYLDEELSRQTGGDGDGDGDDLDDGASTTSSNSVVKLHRHSSLGITGLGLPAFEPKRRPRNNSTSTSSSTTNSTTTNNNIPNPLQSPPPPPPPPLVFTESDISHLSLLTQTTHTPIAVTRYQLNTIAFLRTHRAVSPGSVTPTATQHLARLCRSLAPLHGLDYVTPSLVALAVRKVYVHRIQVVADPARERSVQWGSDARVVGGLLEGVGAEEVVEEVLGVVRVPC
ncbi:hypothetical protein C8A00DRAFT_43908 [Chaetomidium leptoderma]|uniref:magnesium chelatase n=1 Tax=Chaetomidium leptoderma TaxID=669021 RepID=A0AAN6ZWQ9_9PEZI|nr:hypothetical protein C8A00DRAFT_43908 [Chaetomidium leptoderma]